VLRRLKSKGFVGFSKGTKTWFITNASRPLAAANAPNAPAGATRMVVLLDSSSSMRVQMDDIQRETLASIKDAQERGFKVSLFEFSDRYRALYASTCTRQVLDFASWRNQPYGNTPLNDAIVETCLDADKACEEAVVCLIITDGQENASNCHKHSNTVRAAIRNRIDRGNWTFAMLVPPGQRSNMSLIYGIDGTNIREWESSNNQSVRGAYSAVRDSTMSFSNTRLAGQLQTNTGYFAPDLSKLTTTQVAATLTDMSGKVKVTTVPKQVDIRSFVESKTGSPYMPGQAFYQLNKRERKLSSQKEILIQDKTTGKIYGGIEARKLIGLPETRSWRDVKVEPGNHANYDIFVQSMSSNRILPRGAKVAYLG
jgi:hypothetical protein